MQTMKSCLLLLLTVVLAADAGAQKVVDITQGDADVIGQERITGLVGGQVMSPVKYVKVIEGTPFFREEWLQGAIVLNGGTLLGHLDLRLDLLRHELHYKNGDGQEMIATTPVSAVTLSAGGGNFTFVPGTPWREVDKALDGAWLQVLVNDKVSLLREDRKKLSENTPYGSSTTEQTISDADYYYLRMNGQFLRIRTWSRLPEMLGDRKKAVLEFIATNHLTGSTPEEYTQVVTYYNTLIDSQKITKE